MTAPALFCPRVEPWPDELRTAWAALSAPEQRLMLRARLVWRSWPNPGPTPPRPPQRRPELLDVTALLYAVELDYRGWSACRGGVYDLTHTVSATPREQGARQRSTPADLLALLDAHPDGLTTNELLDMLLDVSRHALQRWLNVDRQRGRVVSTPRGAALVWRRVTADTYSVTREAM